MRTREKTQKEKRKNMNKTFDQLAKGVAESVTRRQALKRFATGLVGMALAGFALSSKADRTDCLPSGSFCGRGTFDSQCGKCCSHSNFCIHSEDIARTCFCN